MKTVDIIIPTTGRLSSLMRLLHSIPNKHNIITRICFDNDQANYNNLNHIIESGKYCSNKAARTYTYLTLEQKGSVYCRNLMSQYVEDGLLFLCDDMEFDNKFNFDYLLEEFNVCFPDDDGVLGIKQDLPEYHPTGVALIGKKFLERYPNKQFLNPEYWLFAAFEIHWLATSLGRFVESNQIIKHYHPAWNLSEKDNTHKLGRKYHAKDRAIKKERLQQDLIWGKK